jgi:hypothetical protein
MAILAIVQLVNCAIVPDHDLYHKPVLLVSQINCHGLQAVDNVYPVS